MSTENQDLDDFIAEFKCDSAINGVIKCQITNYDTLFDLNEYYTSGDECMELVYRSMPAVKDSDPSIDKIWRVKDVFLSNLSYDGDFYIRVPVYLHHYNFEFGIKTFDTSTNKWWPRSPTQTVNIPSFLCETIYCIDDVISFRNPLNCRVSEGKIMDKLDDGNYKILYEKYDDKNNIKNTHQLTVHISKMYRKDVGEIQMIQICDDVLMYTHLLTQRNDRQSLDTFDAIKSCYEMTTQNYCYEMYGNDEFMFHWESMADFVSINIFKYLFAAQFCYKLDCLVGGIHETHGLLQLCNLRVKDITNDYNMVINGVDNAEINVNSFDHIQYHCDCCRASLTEWDFVYSCFAIDWDDTHDFCLLCVDTVIQLNQQLATLLSNILNDILNMDCVQQIVNYVIGRVIYTEFNTCNVKELDMDNDQIMMDTNVNNNKKKRKLYQDDMPNAKKRRLN